MIFIDQLNVIDAFFTKQIYYVIRDLYLLLDRNIQSVHMDYMFRMMIFVNVGPDLCDNNNSA